MARPSSATPYEIAYYEGLVFKTTSMYVEIVEDDFDDVQQFLRIKVWRALESFDPALARQTVDGYVFQCMRNGVKDLLKKKRRDLSYIEDHADHYQHEPHGSNAPRPLDRFEHSYLSADHEQTFGAVDEQGALVMPSTLTPTERSIVALLYAGYTQKEAAVHLGLRRAEMERSVKSIRQKLADWRPSNIERAGLPLAA